MLREESSPVRRGETRKPRCRDWRGGGLRGFRSALEKALAYGDGAKGGRPPYDPVAMFKVLILAAQNTVSDARMDPSTGRRASWMRRWWQPPGSATPRPRRRRSRRAGARPRSGRTSRQGGAEGHRCALDAEVRQRPAAARRQAGDRHRHPEFRLQKQHRNPPASPSSGDLYELAAEGIEARPGSWPASPR